MMEDQFFIQSKGCELATFREARDIINERKESGEDQRKTNEKMQQKLVEGSLY